MMVDRYDFDSNVLDVEPQGDGRFVLYSEYVELEAKVEWLRRITSDESLYKHFSRAFDVNRYDESFGGEFPSLDFFIHEVWKRNPKVAELQATIEVLVKAQETSNAELAIAMKALNRIAGFSSSFGSSDEATIAQEAILEVEELNKCKDQKNLGVCPHGSPACKCTVFKEEK